MTPLVFWYDVEQDSDHVAATAGELDAAMDAVAALGEPEWAPVAEITLASGWESAPSLHVGFHGEVGMVRFAAPDGSGQLFTHDVENAGCSPVIYMYGETDMEVPANGQLPIASIRRAVHEFAVTGELPKCVAWQHWRAPFTPKPGGSPG